MSETTLSNTFSDIQVYYHIDIFNTKRKIAVAGAALLGITLLILGILSFLHFGPFGNLTSVGAWSLIIGGGLLVTMAFGFLGYNMHQEKSIKTQCQSMLNTPIKNPEFQNDVKKIKSHYMEFDLKYLTLDGNAQCAGWLDLGELGGLFVVSGYRQGCVLFFDSKESEKAWCNNTVAQAYTWERLRALSL